MEIVYLNDEFITKKCDEVYKRRRQLNEEAWKQGWRDAINFAKEVSKAYTICEQCGKLITTLDYSTDNQGVPFCSKCYDKLFNTGADASNRK